MTEKDDFLSRWSRRKQEAAREARPPRQDEATASAPEQVNEPAGQHSAAPTQGTSKSGKAEPVFDLGKLPSLDSIGPKTDIRIFMHPGVPASLSREALRRAWSADPAIRDFVGLSENSWDFTKPDSIAGFGALLPIDDVKKLVSQILTDTSEPPRAENEPPQSEMRQPSANEEPEEAPSQLAGGEVDSVLAASSSAAQGEEVPRCTENDPALQQERLAVDGAPVPSKRRHGSALPT